ncbi:MAG: phosphoribosyltransferase [Gemmatimonadaceae bacterium]
MTPYFLDRHDAGRRLAAAVFRYADQSDLLILALPRGGVPVAYEVARALHAPLDVFLVRKLGFPGHEKLAMGAIATGRVRILDQQLIQMYGVPAEVIERATAAKRREMERRERVYRDVYPPRDVRARTVILTDDGLATGSTVRAAVEALREEGVRRMAVAVPVAPLETYEALREEVDGIVCAVTLQPFRAVGIWHADFSETTDDEVRELLARAGRGGSYTRHSKLSKNCDPQLATALERYSHERAVKKRLSQLWLELGSNRSLIDGGSGIGARPPTRRLGDLLDH